MAAPGLSCGTWDICCGTWTLSCGMWDLVPWPGIEPGSPTLGAQRLSHWTTREVPKSTSLSYKTKPLSLPSSKLCIHLWFIINRIPYEQVIRPYWFFPLSCHLFLSFFLPYSHFPLLRPLSHACWFAPLSSFSNPDLHISFFFFNMLLDLIF